MDAPMIPNGRNIPDRVEISTEVLEEIDALKRSASSRVIVNLARIMDVKRQDLIARVCKRLELEGFDFVMLMIGRRGDERVVQGVEATGCSSVHLLGERTNPLQYLAAADGYCLMSSYEGMPISLIEALGCHCVPVCTPVGGIKNVVRDGVNGFLAEDLSEAACYLALKRFLDTDKATLEQMKKEARVSYAPYSMRECAQKYVELFQNNA